MIIIDFVRDPNMKLPRNQRTSRKESNLLNVKKTNKHLKLTSHMLHIITRG